MVLKIFKSNRSVNLFLFPLVAAVLWLKSLIYPFSYSYFPGEDKNLLYSPVYNLVEANPFVQVILSLALVILIGYLLQLNNYRYSFIRIRNKLAPLLFVLIVSGFSELHTLHPVYFAGLFLLFALYRMFAMFENTRPYSEVFDVGMMLGVGTLFYFNLFILYPAFLIGIAVLSHNYSWRLFVINLLGFLVPFFFAFSYAIFTEQTMELLKVFEQNVFTPVNHFRTNIPLHGLLSFLGLLIIIASIEIVKQYDSKKVSSRKYFQVLFYIFVFSIISVAFIPAASKEMLVLTAIPVSYVMTNLFVFMKSRFWSEFLFILLLAIVITMQFIP